jgi:hypothetical protein
VRLSLRHFHHSFIFVDKLSANPKRLDLNSASLKQATVLNELLMLLIDEHACLSQHGSEGGETP